MPSNHETSRIFDSYEASYSETVNKAVSFTGLSVDFFTKVKVSYLIDIAHRRLRDLSSRSILDIGCGIGNFHAPLSPIFKTVTGVDISPTSIETARERHPDVQYDVYNGVTLPYENGSFDIAMTICVMHHVPSEQWPTFASEMARVLKPGGVALVFEHNPQNPMTMRAVNNCPFDADAVLLRGDKTQQLLSNAGLQAEPPRYILTIPAANRPLRRIDHLFSRFPMGAQYYVEAVRK